MNNQEKILNLPNVLTMLRMALIAVFLLLFANGHYYWAMAVFIIAGVTDFLDGYIARKRKLITNFGKLMDPLADKLMLIAALVCFTRMGWMPLWIVIVVVVKELIMVVGGYFLLKAGVVVQARLIGKVATVVFITAVVATFLHEFIAPFHTVLQYMAVTCSVTALFWYAADIVKKYRARR